MAYTLKEFMAPDVRNLNLSVGDCARCKRPSPKSIRMKFGCRAMDRCTKTASQAAQPAGPLTDTVGLF
jgi:hypothetical protein